MGECEELESGASIELFMSERLNKLKVMTFESFLN
jgi:hypothetical protein